MHRRSTFANVLRRSSACSFSLGRVARLVYKPDDFRKAAFVSPEGKSAAPAKASRLEGAMIADATRIGRQRSEAASAAVACDDEVGPQIDDDLLRKERGAIFGAIKVQERRRAAALVATHVRRSPTRWEQMRSARCRSFSPANSGCCARG